MRYAVYFCPERTHPIVTKAETWLGRSVFGRDVPAASVEGLSAEQRAPLVASPRRYGFHATLKPPFHLKDGCLEQEFLSAVDDFAAHAPTPAPVSLALTQFKGFFALTPNEPAPALEAFAGSVVSAFEPFRAPLSANDVARRNPEHLSERQRDNLNTWGYPFVFEDFRFHMTLSERLEPPTSKRVGAALKAWFSPLLADPVAIDRIVVFREPERGAPFLFLHEAMLTGALQEPA